MSQAELDARLAALREQLAQLVAEHTAKTSQANSEEARYLDWGIATSQGQESYNNLLRLRAELRGISERIEGVRSQIAALETERQAMVDAIAHMVANGMSIEAATIKAESDASRAELVNNIIKVAAVLALVALVAYGITLFIRWKRSRK